MRLQRDTEVSWVTGGQLFWESSRWCTQITKGGRAWALGPKGLWSSSTSPSPLYNLGQVAASASSYVKWGHK